MKQEKLYNGLTKDDFIKNECKPTIPELWGNKGDEYTPYLCTNVLGDGECLLYVSPLSTRPMFWLILIDSNTELDSNDFDIEDVLQVIEDECGTWDYFDEDYLEQEYHNDADFYPRIYWDGGSYGVIKNFKTGFDL